MTTYAKITDFASKDALLTGNPAKIVKGVEIDDEFNSIATADASNVKGPITASTDNSIVRWDGTTGRAVQNTNVTISDADVLSAPTLSVTGNTTLGDASTDTVTVNGSIGIGGVGGGNSAVAVASARLLTGAGLQHGFSNNATFDSTATNVSSFRATGSSQAAAYTIASWRGFEANNPAKGAGSTITDLHGVYVADQTQGTNNHGVTSLVSSGTNKWNIYASGTAANYFAGNVGIGTNVPASYGKFVVDTVGGNAVVFGDLATSANETSLYMRSSLATIATAAAGAFRVTTGLGGTERLRIDSAGNGGWGVVPSAWRSTHKAIETPVGALYDSGGSIGLAHNAYRNAANTWIYRTTAAASYYDTYGAGGHVWFTAPSGTAGNPITFTQSLAVGLGTTLALEGATSAAGTGIAFPSTQLASSNANTLDDYEEGTFTPTIVGTSTAGAGTYTTQVGRYTKIGRIVQYQINLVWSAHTGTGNMNLTGLPFTTVNSANAFSAPHIYNAGVSMTAGNVMQAYTNVNGTTVVLEQVPTGGGSSAAIPIDTAGQIIISGVYEAA